MKAFIIICKQSPNLVLSKGRNTKIWLYREWDKIQEGGEYYPHVEPVVFKTRKSAKKHLWNFNALEEIEWE